MNIFVVGSTSKHKLAAVEKAISWFGPINASLESLASEVRGIKTDSGVNEQPFGLGETTSGAMSRAQSALEQVPDAKCAIGIESGMMRLAAHVFVDQAVIVLLERGRAEPVVATSVGVQCPSRFVEAALATGCKRTAGDFFAEAVGCDGTDWQSFVTGGEVSREEQLARAVFATFVIKFGQK